MMIFRIYVAVRRIICSLWVGDILCLLNISDDRIISMLCDNVRKMINFFNVSGIESFQDG